MRPGLSEIENAFQPAREVDDPGRFAGRQSEVESCYYGLLTEGANIAIVGNRGIGKTSLARQVIRIATGQNDLLEKLGLPSEEKLDYLPIYYACGDGVPDLDALLERLLTSKACLEDWIYDIREARKQLEAYKPQFSAGIVSLGGEKSVETQAAPAIQGRSIDVVFANVLHTMASEKIARNGILIVVDEFDRIGNPVGVASFLKSLATNVPSVKFCLVGVAQDLRNLMQEHESVDRLFAGSIIKLPPMSAEELGEVIDIAERRVHTAIQFDDSARRELVKLAQGHPYLVHLIGKYCLRFAYQGNREVVDSHAVRATLATIAERGADPILEGRYKKAVGSSNQREIVLRSMARCQQADSEIWTGKAYKLAIDAGVDNASQYVGQLVTSDWGAEIERVRDRYYRFRDSLFAAYALARPPVFGADAEPHAAADGSAAAER